MTVAVALAKVTIGTPDRWLDVALPEDVPLIELLPYILRHAGDDAADNGERHGGWVLRRSTGESLDNRRTLSAQKVLDGEVLHLVPGQLEWAELEYDDVVESIASGARRYGRSWSRAATRRGGLLVCAAFLLSGIVFATRFTAPWSLPGAVLLAIATVLTGLGLLVARALPDVRAGVMFAGCALPYAFLGGLVVTGPDHAALSDLGSSHLLLGCVTLTLFGLAGAAGIADLARVFTAAIAVGVFGIIGSLLAGSLAPDAAAAVTVTIAIGLLPGYPLLAIRAGRPPLPVLPQRASELLEESEQPEKETVFAAAARTDEILTGLLAGASVVGVVCAAVLASHGGRSQLYMLLAVAVALLLRSRLFAVTRHRLPLLSAGVVVALQLIGVSVGATNDNAQNVFLLVLTGVLGGLAAGVGIVYSAKNPSPYLGRLADIFDVVAVLALVPFACVITGLFAFVRGVMAGIG